MVDLKAFRKANKLTQDTVAAYLGVSKTFICNVEKGNNKLPVNHLDKLRSNPYGWDVLMLSKQNNEELTCQNNNIVSGNGNAVGNNSINTATDSQLIAEIAAQRRLTEKSQEQIDRLLGIIEKLSNH